MGNDISDILRDNDYLMEAMGSVPGKHINFSVNTYRSSSVFKRSLGILNVLLLRNGSDYSSLNSTEYITVWNITSMPLMPL